MARTNYSVGKVTVEGNTVGDSQNATLNMTGVDWEKTAIGDANPSYEDVTEEFEISISSNYNAVDPGQAMIRAKFTGGSRTLTSCAYYEDATKSIAGSGLITACSLVKSVGTYDQFTATIRSSGTWSYS